jgi:hypothetical protein
MATQMGGSASHEPVNQTRVSPILGWATYEEFPVDIAQRQIDNGWGAYEIATKTSASVGGKFATTR